MTGPLFLSGWPRLILLRLGIGLYSIFEFMLRVKTIQITLRDVLPLARISWRYDIVGSITDVFFTSPRKEALQG